MCISQKGIPEDKFHSEMASAFDVMITKWLSAKAPKVGFVRLCLAPCLAPFGGRVRSWNLVALHCAALHYLVLYRFDMQ